MAWPGTMTRWSRPDAGDFTGNVSTMLRGSAASFVGDVTRERKLSKMERVRRASRTTALKLVRRAGARRNLEKERGEWLRIL